MFQDGIESVTFMFQDGIERVTFMFQDGIERVTFMFQDGIERVTTPKVPRAMPGTEITVVPCTLYTFRFPLKGQCHKSYFSFFPKSLITRFS